jgi:hypothetical protein
MGKACPAKVTALPHAFDNLLPDSPAICKRVAERIRTGFVEAFDLPGAHGLLPCTAPNAWALRGRRNEFRGVRL